MKRIGSILQLRLAAATLGLLVCLAFVNSAAGSPSATACIGSLSGTTIGDLVVPSGAVCNVENATVTGDVRVDSTGTLDATDTSFDVGGGIAVATDGTLRVVSSETVNLGTTFTVGRQDGTAPHCPRNEKVTHGS